MTPTRDDRDDHDDHDDHDLDECRDRCYLHGREPLTERTYRVCGECGHAFEAQELLDAAAALLADVRAHDEAFAATHPDFGPPPPPETYAPPTDPAEVRVCPLCTHDF